MITFMTKTANFYAVIDSKLATFRRLDLPPSADGNGQQLLRMTRLILATHTSVLG